MKKHVVFAFGIALSMNFVVAAESTPIDDVIKRAGNNTEQIKRALSDVPKNQLPGMQFLIQHMPEHDLKSLTADFLLENVNYAYRAWNESPWKDQISEDIFFNDVLPYANINERRDRWRKDFYEKFKPIIKDISDPGAAADRHRGAVRPSPARGPQGALRRGGRQQIGGGSLRSRQAGVRGRVASVAV